MISLFKKSYTPKEINFFRYLSRIKLFEKLTYEEMAHFSSFFYLREYKSDEVVYFRNDPSHALYLVKSGKVSLCIDIHEGFENLKIIKSGSAFGENTLLDETFRVYNAIIASESAELYVLPKVNIDDVFNSHMKVKAKMLESLAELYNERHINLFKEYKSNYGLFSLSQMFGD